MARPLEDRVSDLEFLVYLLPDVKKYLSDREAARVKAAKAVESPAPAEKAVA